jgi:hypothetical protein
VLTSWLYRQTADVQIDGVSLDDEIGETLPPPYFVGPSKPLDAEVWLAVAQQVTSYSIGACDARYGDGFPYFQLFGAQMQGLLSQAELNDQITTLHGMREDRVPLVVRFGYNSPDTTFSIYARLLGGCPGFQNTRSRPTGVAYALLQEGVASTLCQPGLSDLARPAGPVTAESVARHLFPMLLSRDPTTEDIEILQQESGCIDDSCAGNVLTSSACTAILGSAEFLFR